MGVESNGHIPFGEVVDRVVVTGAELMKEWRGALRRVNLPGVKNAFIGVTSSLHRGAFREYALVTYVVRLGKLTDKENSDLAMKSSQDAYERMLRARKGDFS